VIEETEGKRHCSLPSFRPKFKLEVSQSSSNNRWLCNIEFVSEDARSVLSAYVSALNL
jgi:hypothetical protein